MILLRKTNFNFAKVNVKRFFQKSLSKYFERVPQLHKGFLKERLILANKRDELPKVQTQISAKHFYPFLRFELRAPKFTQVRVTQSDHKSCVSLS